MTSTPLAVSSSIVDYPARDMTVTAGAAMPFGELRHILEQENQQLPIDVADDTITIGEMVASDISGPRQFGYGTLRDYVIGIEAVDGTGRVFHAGGRVVKNVAGYDLCRLLVGSENQLGTLTQLTFKLKPLPLQTSLHAVGFRSLRDLETALDKLNLTATTPVLMDVLSRQALRTLLSSPFPEFSQTTECLDSCAVLIVGFEGPAVACEWQATTLKEELAGTTYWTKTASDPQASANYCRHMQQASQADFAGSSGTDWMARLVTLPSRVVSAITVLQDAGCEVFGRAGNGVLFVRPTKNSDEERPELDESAGFALLQSLVSEGIGSVEAIRAKAARSTIATPAVQQLSQKLRFLLGSAR